MFHLTIGSRKLQSAVATDTSTTKVADTLQSCCRIWINRVLIGNSTWQAGVGRRILEEGWRDKTSCRKFINSKLISFYLYYTSYHIRKTQLLLLRHGIIVPIGELCQSLYRDLRDCRSIIHVDGVEEICALMVIRSVKVLIVVDMLVDENGGITDLVADDRVCVEEVGKLIEATHTMRKIE